MVLSFFIHSPYPELCNDRKLSYLKKGKRDEEMEDWRERGFEIFSWLLRMSQQ